MRVVVFGTFDRLHPGHVSFFKQAKKLGGFLLVVVARDFFVNEAKGKLPQNQERKRASQIRKLEIADQVILGSKTHDFPRTLRSRKIDTIALGYDQKPTIWQLRKALRRHRLGKIKIVRLRPLRPDIYKSSKITRSAEPR